MIFEVTHQERYSRGELLLRSFFGIFFILLPHAFLLFFASIWSAIIGFIAFWAILFTGRYPQSFFEFQVGLINWQNRVSARLYNLCDGYPSFGVSGTDEYTNFVIPYPETISRSTTLLRAFFGLLYVSIPHGFALYFRLIGTSVLSFLAFWSVLFTGSYPKSWHEFNVGTLRWSTRVSLYMSHMSDEYPVFSGRRSSEIAS